MDMNESNLSQNNRKSSEIKLPTEFSLSVEEKLKILAHLVVDRMLEDKRNDIQRVKIQKQEAI
ncbi:hypothetical protein H3C66_05060 [Patescibacteria group bacterium]|nr:hypothetical protein [Patescibacteria group bacterium]